MADRTPHDIRIDRPHESVLRLTTHGPEVHNALRTQTLAEIAAQLADAARDDALRAVVLTGQPISAAEAVAAGIAIEADEPESALARAVELAAVIAAKPPLAVRLAKEAVLRAFEVPLSEALAAERQAFALLAASDDRNEGIAAFLDKRTPRFTGR